MGGHSDRITTWLRENGVNGTFFVLGQSLQARLQKTSPEALNALYAGQCVASHGWEHKSHASWDQWQDSVTRVQALLGKALPDRAVPLFRPPYGQRQADSGAFFAGQGCAWRCGTSIPRTGTPASAATWPASACSA